MSRALALTQRQVRAICEGAKKAGCVPVLEFGKDAVLKLVPKEDLPDESTGRVDGKKRIRL